MRKIIMDFDNELEKLRLEKYRLEVNMKCADLKVLVMYQVCIRLLCLNWQQMVLVFMSPRVSCGGCVTQRPFEISVELQLLITGSTCIFTSQELKVLRKLQPMEDALDLRLNQKLNEEADILVRSSFQNM